jgi:hypothetical protein
VISQSRLHPTYELILGEWEKELEDLERKIFQALRSAYPDGLTRRELIFSVYGVLVHKDEDLNNNAMDRKIRKTIAAMFDNLIPVVSSSGSAGYRLELDPETIRKMIQELKRRIDQYTHKVERGHRLLMKLEEVGAAAIPESLPEEPRQMSFIR